jgi:hypothetical protein
MSFSHLHGAPSISLRDGQFLIAPLWYVQRGDQSMSCGLYRSGPLGMFSLQLFQNGLPHQLSSGGRDALLENAAAHLVELLADGWEQIP